MPNWSQGAQGAAGGAAAGGVLGGPWGAAAGGVVGGALGLFGGSSTPQVPGQDRRGADLLEQIRRSTDERNAMQLGPQERTGGGVNFRSNQMDLIRQLRNQAAGKGPSLAGMQANAVAQQSLAQQQAMAAGASQGNEALAARQSAMNAGNTMNQLAQTSAQARMAEQMAAQGMLGGVLAGARGQDMNNEQFNATGANNMNMANAQLGMDQRRLNDARNMGLRQLELGNAQGGMSAPNTLGTQTMSGGANLLAMYGMGQFGRKPEEQGVQFSGSQGNNAPNINLWQK